MMRLTASIALGLGVFLSEPSLAVTLDPVQGEVTINRGDGIFRPVTGTIKADIGDSVMVRPGGTAWLVYSDTCRIEVNPGSVVTVTVLSPCEAPPSENTATEFSVGGAAVGGGLAIGAIVGAVLLLRNNNKDQPASP